jgi:hypothetical protein
MDSYVIGVICPSDYSLTVAGFITSAFEDREESGAKDTPAQESAFGPELTLCDVRCLVAMRSKADVTGHRISVAIDQLRNRQTPNSALSRIGLKFLQCG